ncbi:hypothetical protein [Paradevosia shaoguanensis]|uniref:hypothetical protein n=1 Tax=Paradevosia shaoguanensis TaxID=1335043 RepID=UPI0019341F04|nr:hypothetical protein [Paradevosia shaoguanensis]
MTTTNPPTTPNLAQLILQDTTILKRDLGTILQLAKTTALPMSGEEASVLDTMIRLLQMIVTGVEQNRQSLEALHQRLEEPGIAHVLRRMLDAD